MNRGKIEEAEKLGLAELQIIEIGMRVRFIVPLVESIPTTRVTEQVTEQVERLLECLKNEPLTSREAMKCLDLRHRPTFLYEYLQPAMNKELIEMTQPDSPKSPTQKYRLTDKGRNLDIG